VRATLLDLSRIPESPSLVLSGTRDGVSATVSPEILNVTLDAPVYGISTQRLAPLWHSPGTYPRLTITVENSTDATKLLRFSNVTVDLRFHASYARWIYSRRRVSEQQGGSGAEAQDGLRPNGSLSLLLLPREARTVQIEVRAPLEDGVDASRILNSVDIAVENSEPIRLRSLLVLSHPQSPLLEDLPSIYREAMTEIEEDLTPPESPFFSRYLRGFDDAITPIRAALNKMELLFGPHSTPPDLLLWLAAWVCMPLDENWPEMKRRKLVAEAVELFRWRGTARGLSRFLRIYTGVVPTIHDQPQPGVRLGEQTLIGADDTIIGDIPAHTFSVTIAHPAPETLDERILHSIIELEKPAHTGYRLMILRQESYNVASEQANAT
jgi:phage tail-like protein